MKTNFLRIIIFSPIVLSLRLLCLIRFINYDAARKQVSVGIVLCTAAYFENASLSVKPIFAILGSKYKTPSTLVSN